MSFAIKLRQQTLCVRLCVTMVIAQLWVQYMCTNTYISAVILLPWEHVSDFVCTRPCVCVSACVPTMCMSLAQRWQGLAP